MPWPYGGIVKGEIDLHKQPLFVCDKTHSVDTEKETLKCFVCKKSYSGWSRAHLAVSSEWVLSQTNESCLCELISRFHYGPLWSSIWLHHSHSTDCYLVCITSHKLPTPSAFHHFPPVDWSCDPINGCGSLSICRAWMFAGCSLKSDALHWYKVACKTRALLINTGDSIPMIKTL